MDRETVIVKKDSENREFQLERAAQIIRSGGLVVFPTETVYGLGADATNRDAVRSIFRAKGRPQDNPLIVHISDISQLEDVADSISDRVMDLVSHFWPGPLTVLFQKKDILPDETTGGLETVAVRMPDNDLARELIRKAKRPIAAPSANISGRPSPTRIDHVVEDLYGKVDMIIDGGPTGVGLESTVIDATGEKPLILRPGSITKEDLKAYLPNIEYDLSIEDKRYQPKSPGQKYRHYSPSADMEIYSGSPEDLVGEMSRKIEEYVSRGLRVGILTVDENIEKYNCDKKISMGSVYNLEDIARNLFSTIREIDSKGVDIIMAEGFKDTGLGKAIMNRMIKAAGGKINYV